jgi:hypothetical protein
MARRWVALSRAYRVLGFETATGGDEVLRALVLARIIEPTRKLDSLRVIEELWHATVRRASTLPEEAVYRSVNGEWSLAQTLRHTIFVVDAWYGHAAALRPNPFHPIGVPASFTTNLSWAILVRKWAGVGDGVAQRTGDSYRSAFSSSRARWPRLTAPGTTSRRP